MANAMIIVRRRTVPVNASSAGHIAVAVTILLLALAVLAVALFFWWKTKRTIKRLDQMLTAAMNGSFSEQSFDESRLSALESRLERYLAASALSARNVREQKDRVIALTVGQRSDSAVFDAKWTEEAVCNLLDNAIKYTPSDGTVTVEVKNYELFSAIRVADTGPGISEEEQAQIFGRFYRASGAWQAEGVGIGLYLTRQIAEKQGGYVKVESTPGKGSVFSLYLP